MTALVSALLLFSGCEPEPQWVSPAQVCEWYDQAAEDYPELLDTGEGHYSVPINYWCGTNLEQCDDPERVRTLNRELLSYALLVNNCNYLEPGVDPTIARPGWVGSVDCGDVGEARYWLCYIAEP